MLEAVDTEKVKVEGKEITTPLPNKEDVLKDVATAQSLLRKIILDVKKLPRDKTLEPHQDELRCLAQAQTQLQTGMMWLKRAINPTKEF